MVFESVETTPYLSPSDLCSQIHRHFMMVYNSGSVIWQWCWREWSLLHRHILLNCVHKYMDIYDGIGLRVLNLEVVLKRVQPIPYLSPSELCSKIHRTLMLV